MREPQSISFRTLILNLIFFCFAFSLQTKVIAAIDRPISINSTQGQITVYQLQPETLQGNALTGRAAVSIQTQNQNVPTFGVFWFNAELATDLDKRTYSIQQFKINKIKFSETTSLNEEALLSSIENELPKHYTNAALDTLQTNLEREQKAAVTNARLETTPPKIIFANNPAVLVTFDGEPKLQAIEDSKLMRAVNTPMLVVFDPTTKNYYLSSGSAWYSTKDTNGPWNIEHNPPAYIANIVTANGKPVTSTISDAEMPKIIVSTTPAELITTDGTPQYTPIKDTNLLYMSNTESNVFLDTGAKKYYVLLSGRWFAGKSLQGPWDFVSPDKLPADFAKIPANSTKGNVLASIPNTQEAQDALITSQIPKTAAIKRSEAKLTVEYNGSPQFKKIRGTKIKYAVNTTIPVLLINGRYYACDNAVWFVADSPTGPWVVADDVPEEVQSIPPSSPVYNVKYVRVYDSTPDIVYVGYTPGYLGFFSFLGTVVFGTGYIYPYWYGGYYYPWPWTYGIGFYYDNYYGWGYGRGWGYAFRSIGYDWHNNWWGRNHWYRPTGWYGPGGFRYRSTNININRNAIFGNQINIGKRNFRFDHNINNNIYNRKWNTGRLAKPMVQPMQKFMPKSMQKSIQKPMQFNQPKSIKTTPKMQRGKTPGFAPQHFKRDFHAPQQGIKGGFQPGFKGGFKGQQHQGQGWPRNTNIMHHGESGGRSQPSHNVYPSGMHSGGGMSHGGSTHHGSGGHSGANIFTGGGSHGGGGSSHHGGSGGHGGDGSRRH
ncbi:MAG: carbohydrate-binding family V/XII [Gammaproteobacteria bacterium]|nr:carbohydrate-binding family V/XII [Gammaproteobacteria bacterium]